jgi:recombination protein RecR
MRVPKPLTNVIESFEKLPGIGPKTAQRLSYYLLHVPQAELDTFADAVSSLKKNTVLCSICKNVSEHDPCDICDDGQRNKNQIMVVEQPLDLLAFERAGRYSGVYHVLHGVINPLENIGPDEIYIQQLLDRVQSKEQKADEIIVATNPTMEGDATAMYIAKRIHEKSERNGLAIHDGESETSIKVTRLGMGIPTGADLEYADETTLRQAFEGRRQL